MKLNQLRYFMHVAELGSFSKAATHLRIAQPALSRQIKMLEDELGVTLLLRDGRGAKLTPVGQDLLNGSVKLFKMLSDLRETVSAKADLVDGVVTIGVPPSVGAAIIPQVLVTCKQTYPHLVIRVMESSSMPVLEEWLASGRIDFAVLNAAVTTSQSLKADRLYSELLYFVGHPDHAEWISPEPITLTACARAPIVVASPAHGIRMMLDRACKELDVDLNGEFEVDSIAVMREMARRGAAFAILPFSVAQPDIEAGRLFGRRIIEPQLVREMLIATSTERPPTPSGRKFEAVLRAEAAKLDHVI
jgi:LysR family nitrogen assimilation transcriptional regulator